MRIKITLLVLSMLTAALVHGQGIPKLTGPLGVYHIASGYSYSDSTGQDSIIIQSEFRFGELAIPNAPSDGRFRFAAEVDSAISWHANRAMGIINPPSEHGLYNNPNDTFLYFSHPVRGTGMIEGGYRFSRLSRLYGPFCGVILDDWNGDTAITHSVYDAVRGKYVDGYGYVYHESFATTPDNKLYCVVYNTDAHPEVLPYMDGLYYSYFQGQDCCYMYLDSDISTLRRNFPHKEIMIAIFLQNSFLGWTDPQSVHYMLAHGLDRYDDGDLNEVNIFAGSFLPKASISIGRWDSIALPHWLDSLYFPYLGEGRGQIYDCDRGLPLSDAFVRVFCQGRLSGDTLFRSRQKTDTSGSYSFGLWAGNRNTDSTYYWLVAEKEGYLNDTVGFWIRRTDTTSIPGFSLCPSSDVPISGDHMLVFPNPSTGGYHVDCGSSGGIIEVYDMMGDKVAATLVENGYAYIDISDRSDGIYVFALRSGKQIINRTRVLLMRH